MGITSSKVGQVPDEDLAEGSVPSTPIISSKSVIKNHLLDPRSPTASIARTPIQLLSTPSKPQNEATTPLNVYPKMFLGIDPRSPTTEFNRTPILLGANDDPSTSSQVYNKRLEKVKQSNFVGVITTPDVSITKASCSDTNIIQPKLLESSPVTTKPNPNKRKSFVGLLETNIDYTETDLDEVIKSKLQASFSNDSPSKANGDVRSPSIDFVPTATLNVSEINPKEAFKLEINTEDSINTVVEINHDEPETVEEDVQVIESETCRIQPNIELVVEVDETEIVLEVESNLTVNIIEEPVITEVDPPEMEPVTEIDNNVTNLTAHVKEFDKKLTHLIYEDHVFAPISPKVEATIPSVRTPLRERNIKSEPSTKSAHKLRVSDKPRKSEGLISKIPVYKDKRERKLEVQCENTPPRNMEKKRIKGRKSQWSGDNTLII